MIDLTRPARLLARRRLARLAALDPVAAQWRTLAGLLRHAAGTRFGRDHGFARIASVAAYQAAVPLRTFEDFQRDYWRADYPCLENVSWPGRIPFFALTSGTTSGTTKDIPVSRAMVRSNRRAALDLLWAHIAKRPDSRVLSGKSFMLGGATALERLEGGARRGDLSGIAMATTPLWARPLLFPPPRLALLDDWEEKLERLAHAALEQRITSLSGTPSWVLVLLDRMAGLRAERGEHECYPALDLFVHGGVRFTPYAQRFHALIDPRRTEYREAYAASEGFIAHGLSNAGLRLTLDTGLFFEFVPAGDLEAAQPTRHWLATIEPGIDYAIVLTTCAGLWAYVLGDTVRFETRTPPRLSVTGRLSYMLSAFGEHLIGEEIEGAVASAAKAIGRAVRDFSAGAVFDHTPGAPGHHLFIVEFEESTPDDAALARFAAILDEGLTETNEDYRAHRSGGVGAPEILAAPPGGFAAWMKRRGRLGGQNKVPRVITDAGLLADLRAFMEALGS